MVSNQVVSNHMFLRYDIKIVFAVQSLTLFLAKLYQCENVNYLQQRHLNLKEQNILMHH